jgi:CobQ-like glutamine amidotransferase family enzyme
MTTESAVRVVLVYPDLLGTYGDSGNATILAQRLRWRGYQAEVTTIRAGQTVPSSCDLYVVGGGEDLPQALAARDLGAGADGAPTAVLEVATEPSVRRPLHRAVDSGAVVFAVCAGLQILGRSFVGPDGVEAQGLGLLDCRSVRGAGRRAVGELVVQPDLVDRLPLLSGFENHGAVTSVGPGSQPLGRVVTGVGNGDGSDGAVSGRVMGTYLHGPALARNPDLADLLLSWAVGDLTPLDDWEALELRRERLRAAGATGDASQRGRLTAGLRVRIRR